MEETKTCFDVRYEVREVSKTVFNVPLTDKVIMEKGPQSNKLKAWDHYTTVAPLVLDI